MPEVKKPDRQVAMHAIIMELSGVACSIKRDQLNELFEEDHELSALDIFVKVALHGVFESDFSTFFIATMREVASATAKGLDPVAEVELWLEGLLADMSDDKIQEILDLYADTSRTEQLH